VSARRGPEGPGYGYEGRLRGLVKPAFAGFVTKSRGLQPPGEHSAQLWRGYSGISRAVGRHADLAPAH